MNDETVGQAVFVININDTAALQELSRWQSQVDKTMSDGQKSTQSLADGFGQLQDSIAQLATAGLAFGGLKEGISSVIDAYNQYEASLNGVKAVASATGNDISISLESIKEITSGGLITQADAAAAMKNLQLYGYSVEEAAQMIRIMGDAAVYNRQANYSVSEAVRVTTEGIRMENSVLSDASGITTNIAKMYEIYAAQLGKTTNSLTQAEKAQAVYNGFLREGGIFAGNAEEYTQTLAGSQQQLDAAMMQVSQTMGAMFSSLSPVVSGFAEWVTKNQELVAWIGTFVGILVGGTGLVAALNLAVKAAGVFGNALTLIGFKSNLAKGGIIGIVTALAGLAASWMLSAGLDSMEDLGETTEDVGESSVNTADNLTTLGKSMEDTAKRVGKLQQEMNELDRDFRRNLKQIAVKHGENIDTLTQQIEEANEDYRRAIAERNADFETSFAKQERSHQETVNELMNQLNFLQRYNNQYNKEKLAQVQFALAKEEELYKKETEKQRAEIELQNAADKEKLDKKLQSLQQELDDEVAFMNKHRETLNAVRDEILLDEVESLRERYEKQRASLNEQIAEAAKAGADAANAYWNEYNRVQAEKLKVAKVQIDNFQNSIKWDAEKNAGQAVVIDPASLAGHMSGWSDGGYTGRGGVDEVAGIVHKGEYVIPAKSVDQNTGQPMVGSTQNITINLAGILATSPQAKRDLAQEIIRAIQQTSQSRLQTSGGVIA